MSAESQHRFASQESIDRDAAVARFREDGYVIVENALPPELVSELQRRYHEALDAKVDRLGIKPATEIPTEPVGYGRPIFRPVGGNHDVNRWNMHLPSRAPFLDSRLIANPNAMAIIDAILGDDCVLAGLMSDAAYPGSQFQTVHQDSTALRITVNVPMVDFREDNGPLELWPGSHRRAAKEPFSPKNMLTTSAQAEAVANAVPSKRIIVKAGTLIIRDQRTLHRGTPNLSNERRAMLALLYFHGTRELPSPAVVDVAARAATRVRELARARNRSELLNRANAAGRIIEFMARTDRHYRRPIPSEVWAELSPRAKTLLRYAPVDGKTQGRRTLRASVSMLRKAVGGNSSGIGGIEDL